MLPCLGRRRRHRACSAAGQSLSAPARPGCAGASLCAAQRGCHSSLGARGAGALRRAALCLLLSCNNSQVPAEPGAYPRARFLLLTYACMHACNGGSAVHLQVMARVHACAQVASHLEISSGASQCNAAAGAHEAGSWWQPGTHGEGRVTVPCVYGPYGCDACNNVSIIQSAVIACLPPPGHRHRFDVQYTHVCAHATNAHRYTATTLLARPCKKCRQRSYCALHTAYLFPRVPHVRAASPRHATPRPARHPARSPLAAAEPLAGRLGSAA